MEHLHSLPAYFMYQKFVLNNPQFQMPEPDAENLSISTRKWKWLVREFHKDILSFQTNQPASLAKANTSDIFSHTNVTLEVIVKQ